MNEIADVASRKARAPFVKFVRVPVEDRVASQQQGRYVARDVDFVHVTAPYSKDIFKQEAADWFQNVEREAAAQRMAPQWLDQWKADYQRWKNGQEVPLRGTPIKGWPVISPAQQETLIHAGILTVEDLAGVNDEGIRRVGMGAVELKKKADSWLRTAEDKGAVAMENAALKEEVGVLKNSLATLQTNFEELKRSMAALRGPMEAAPVPTTITAADLMDDADEPPKRGRPRGS